MSTLSVENLQHPSSSNANITLDSNGNINLGAGSASLPSITAQGDTNTGIYFPAADNIGFATGGTIRGRWTDNGLCFGTDTAAANALDDYEEGTWTPTDASGAGLTFTTAQGSYTKIGNMVFARCVVTYPSTANGNNALIGGLPFTVANANAARQGILSYADETTARYALPDANATTFDLRDAGGTRITNNTLSTNAFFATLVYPVS